VSFAPVRLPRYGPVPPKSSKSDKDKKSKKDAQLVLRLDRELRDGFVDACKELDTSAAREVRKFIKRFLKKYKRGELNDH